MKIPALLTAACLMSLTMGLAMSLPAGSALGQANTKAAVADTAATPAAPATEAPAAEATGPVMVPQKPYVHLDEALTIRFLEPRSPEARTLYNTVGFKAADLPNQFTPVAGGQIVDGDGNPIFKLYNLEDKKPVEAGSLKVQAGNGTVDLAAVYPKIKEGGTFVLTWKNATPLVIETLANPGWSRKQYEANKAELEALPPDRRKQFEEQFKPTVIHIEPLVYAAIKTSKGDIKAIFYYEVAPHTVDNFIGLAKQDYYDGSAFHRIIKGFMIQGGDPLASTERAGTGGPGYQINQEFNERPHERGVLSMARSQDPNSAGSQFFIMHAKGDSLNGQYTAFGQVVDGMDVVDKIAETKTSGGNGAVAAADRPRIESIRILPATPEMYGIKTK